MQFRNRLPISLAWLAILIACLTLGGVAAAQQIVVHLKGGDKISGWLVSEGINELVISNGWTKSLSIPLVEIDKREIAIDQKTNSPALALNGKTNFVSSFSTNDIAQSVTKPSAKPKGTLKGEVRLGLDAIISTTDQQDYSGHLKLTYERPYDSKPKEFFRNISNFDGEYQKTDGQVSANRGNANNKSDFDVGDRFYGYGQAGVSFDEVQKIDFQYQAGPGVGLHFIQHTNFIMNLENGLNYQVQYRRDTSDLKTFSLRLAENFTWKIWKNLTLTENFAFFPDVELPGQFRYDFESNLSYGFWKNLSLNLTVLDSFDTEVAPDVNKNRFEIRSSLGVTF